jgi:hypothetical protein
VDSGVGHQIGLKFGDIHVQGAVKSEGGGQRGDDLSDQSVQIGVGGPLDVQISPADVIYGLVVEHNGHVGVLQQGVGGQDGVVGLYDGGGNLGRGVDGESQFGFFAVIDGESF